MDRVRIEKNGEGIYLSVVEGVSLSEVLDALEKERLSDIDPKLVEQALSLPGNKVRIFEGQIDRPARINVDISRDSLVAKIAVEPPEGSFPWPSSAELKAALDVKGIIYGIDEGALLKIVKDKISDQWIEVAHGAPPIDGKDSEVEYKVEFGSAKPLDQGNDGKVDMKQLSTVTVVRKGDLLVTRTPFTESHDGISVQGKTLKAKNGKDRKLPAGQGTVASEDETALYADQDGHLVIRGGVLDVLPVYVVPGDVDYSVGNINFIGSVEVKGAVRDGFEIKTTGNVHVSGVIEGARIETDGDLEIKVGVSAGNKGLLKIGGSLTAGYIDKANLEVGENIQVKDSIMHSDVSAGKNVASGIGGGKGQIVGGKIQAGVLVHCVTLGSQMGTKTEVHVGVSPQLANRKAELISLVAENQEKLGQIDTNIGFLKKLEKTGKLDIEKRTILLKLTKGSFQIQSLLSQWKKELEDLDAKVERSRYDAKVRVRDWCYPGVSISMRGCTYLVREDMRFITFMYQDGEIKALPYDR
ncbi:MAG: FapA family protein [Dethiosulfovibrio sp.]|nr:FapA family protein [Dethiosulfovibrio sp.]